MIYILFISIFVPILLMASLIEKRARLPILFVLAGMFVSVFSAEVNGLLRNILPLSKYELTIIITPMTEEFLKALPILFYALIISDKRETLFTASMATGIGFAVLETPIFTLPSENSIIYTDFFSFCFWVSSDIISVKLRNNISEIE